MRLDCFLLSEFDEKLLAAQAFEQFSGGLESTPLVISFCLHELAVNEDIQDRLREEVHRTKAAHHGKVTWDAVDGMEYLDMVVKGAEPSSKHVAS